MKPLYTEYCTVSGEGEMQLHIPAEFNYAYDVVDRLPRVTEKNVLILKYYSFENYFRTPTGMNGRSVFRSCRSCRGRRHRAWPRPESGAETV